MLLVVPVHPVMAWSEGGHHLIAMLAFRMLKPEEQTVLIEILKAHPQFDQEFQIPPNIRGPEEARLWLVGRAAYWPDVARGSQEYNRPNWHYQLGSSMVIGNVSSQKVPDSPTGLPTSATLETLDLHIAEALELNRNVLADRTRPASERAIAISWLGHLVADAHQPCHAGSLYVEGLFPEGDRGANSIPTKQRRNLHALWDGLLGERYDSNDVRRRAIEMERDARLVAIGKQSIEGQGKSDPQIWLKESRLSATKYVYEQEVLGVILDATSSGRSSIESLDLSEAYLKSAGNLSKERAIAAAFRLKEVWLSGLADN